MRLEEPDPAVKRVKESVPSTLLLDKVPGNGAPELAQRGQAESVAGSSGGSQYFVLAQYNDRFTVFPCAQWFNFKPPVKRSNVPLTLEEAEAAMARRQRGGANNTAPDARMVPASVKREMELGDGGRKRPIDEFNQGLEDLFEAGSGSEDDADDLQLSEKRVTKRGGKGGTAGAAGGVKIEDGVEIAAEEVAEDVYEGEQDDLRPDRPEGAEDWEHQEDMQDDDEVFGEDAEADAKLEDDPGLRKELGIENEEEPREGDEEEEEEVKPDVKPEVKPEELLVPLSEVKDEEFDDDMDDEDYDLDKRVEADQNVLLGAVARRTPPARAGTPPPAAPQRPPSRQGQAAANGAAAADRGRSPTPARMAAAADATAAGKRKAGGAAGPGTKRARAEAARRAPSPAPASLGTAAAAGAPLAQGPVTEEELLQRLRGGNVNNMSEFISTVRHRIRNKEDMDRVKAYLSQIATYDRVTHSLTLKAEYK